MVKETPDEGILKIYEKDIIVKELKAYIALEEHISETSEGYVRYYSKVYVPLTERARITR